MVVSLNTVSWTKVLGVIIDENLTWKNHIDAISKPISRNIGVLTKLKHFAPKNILYSLYCTLILPYINCGVLIWGNTCKIYLDKIFKLHNSRTISNSHYRSHTGPLFSKYNVLNVHDTFKLNLGIFLYKHHTNQLPLIFSTYFTKHVQIHNYPTRNAQDYSINITKKMFSIVQLEIVDLFFLEFFGRNSETLQKTKQNKTKQTRHVAVTDGVPCRLWDIDPWLTPVSLFIPQMLCKCMSNMNILSNIKEVMYF